MLVNKLNNCKKILGIFTCFLAGSFSDSSLAFTIGDIRLESALNEPLVANIQLLELDGLDESQILVALGSEADFDRFDVEPLPLLNELEFDVQVLSSSEGLVRISSADAIVEPYLNFVLNVRWPSGRVIREYTVLLDLPTFSANPTPAPAPTPARTTPIPPAEPVPPARRSQPEPTQPQVAEAPLDEMSPARGMDTEPETETVVIQTGDSLWNIALATRPGNDVSAQQMMLAIQRANTNSDAFIDNNINGIRAGRVLRIPSREEINAISQEEAITQVAVQNQQFYNNAQPLAVNNSQGSAHNARDELSIVNSVDDDTQSAEIADLNATIANLENELALSEENLDRALLENEELRSRLNDLEEEIAILENIIAIEGQRMAELQAEMANQAETADSEVLAVVADTGPATPEPEVVTEPPMPAPSSPPPSTGLISQITNLISSTLGVVSALVVLLALVVGFLIARNRKAILEDGFDTILAEEEENEEGLAGSVELSELEDFAAADIEDDEEDYFDESLDDDSEFSGDDDESEDEVTADECEAVVSEEDIADEDLEDFLGDVDIDSEEDDSSLIKLEGGEESDDEIASEEPEEELESFQFTVSDDKHETPVNAGTEQKQQEQDDLETFDLGDFTFEDNDEAAGSPKTYNVVSADDEDEIVLDLDDDDSDAFNEIEFLDEDENEDEDSAEENPKKTGSSSLGNLGLDDAIAFDESDEEELEIITDQDEVSTKLDLAVAFQAMDDLAGAKEILNEVIAEGNDAQVAEAKSLLSEWGDS